MASRSLTVSFEGHQLFKWLGGPNCYGQANLVRLAMNIDRLFSRELRAMRRKRWVHQQFDFIEYHYWACLLYTIGALKINPFKLPKEMLVDGIDYHHDIRHSMLLRMTTIARLMSRRVSGKGLFGKQNLAFAITPLDREDRHAQVTRVSLLLIISGPLWLIEARFRALKKIKSRISNSWIELRSLVTRARKIQTIYGRQLVRAANEALTRFDPNCQAILNTIKVLLTDEKEREQKRQASEQVVHPGKTAKPRFIHPRKADYT